MRRAGRHLRALLAGFLVPFAGLAPPPALPRRAEDGLAADWAAIAQDFRRAIEAIRKDQMR